VSHYEAAPTLARTVAAIIVSFGGPHELIETATA
jgi:hypothetical protein